MTTVGYFEKMFLKHLLDLDHAINTNAREEVVENIRFKLRCCQTAIDALDNVKGDGLWETFETATARNAKRKYHVCTNCRRKSAIKEKFCPSCGRKMV